MATLSNVAMCRKNVFLKVKIMEPNKVRQMTRKLSQKEKKIEQRSKLRLIGCNYLEVHEGIK